ncbi:hypothetical protein [Nonomuraea glycinis]|uniref:hypothetical protein n=1 Tax=Nonomuraea glycinis TaxID=2047744 RepID=UPI002E127CC1|nr:hypothetical protein OHA68_43330 [Nonomuraea glycinis]
MNDPIREAWKRKQGTQRPQGREAAPLVDAHKTMGTRAFAHLLGEVADEWKKAQGANLDTIPIDQQMAEIEKAMIQRLTAQED